MKYCLYTSVDYAHCPQHRVKSGASYGIDYCCMVTDLFSFILLLCYSVAQLRDNGFMVALFSFSCFISQRKNYIGYHLIVLSYQDRCHDTIIERTSNLLKIRDAENVPKAFYFPLFLFFYVNNNQSSKSEISFSSYHPLYLTYHQFI